MTKTGSIQTYCENAHIDVGADRSEEERAADEEGSKLSGEWIGLVDADTVVGRHSN